MSMLKLREVSLEIQSEHLHTKPASGQLSRPPRNPFCISCVVLLCVRSILFSCGTKRVVIISYIQTMESIKNKKTNLVSKIYDLSVFLIALLINF